MKKILHLLLLIPTLCVAQTEDINMGGGLVASSARRIDTAGKEYVSVGYDKITGKTWHQGRKAIHIFNKDIDMYLRIVTGSDYPTLHYVFEIKRPSVCVIKGDKIDVLFADNSRTILRNIREYNCDGFFDVCMGSICTFNTISYMFTDHLIEAMRINAGNRSYDIDMQTDVSIEIMAQTIGLIPYFEKLER